MAGAKRSGANRGERAVSFSVSVPLGLLNRVRRFRPTQGHSELACEALAALALSFEQAEQRQPAIDDATLSAHPSQNETRKK
jgi:hypothetical protein